MNLKSSIAIIHCVILTTIWCQTANCQDLSKVIDSIYNFSPGSMSKAQQEEKLKPMDYFWNMVKSDTSKWLPDLRKQLAASDHKPFFYFDGSSLLLSVSNSRADISRCDIADITPEHYVRRLKGLAFDGVDITESALKILSMPNFSFAIPAHAMVFEREYCLAYCLLPLDNRLYTAKLIDMFKTQDSLGQECILLTLWLGYSCNGDELLKKAKTDQSLAVTIREGAIMIDSLSKIPMPALDQYYRKSEDEIMEIRNKDLRRFNNEALDDLTIITLALRAKVKFNWTPALSN